MFDEYARWISPVGMSPRRIARTYQLRGVTLEPEDRAFFMFGSANRDERKFGNPEVFDVTRDVSASIPFGAGPHYCAGAAASKCLIAEVVVPSVFKRLSRLAVGRGNHVWRLGISRAPEYAHRMGCDMSMTARCPGPTSQGQRLPLAEPYERLSRISEKGWSLSIASIPDARSQANCLTDIPSGSISRIVKPFCSTGVTFSCTVT